MDKPKFNLMDGLIILLIVMVAAVGVFLLRGMGSGEGTAVVDVQSTTAEFKIQLTKVDKSLCDKFTAAMESGESVWIGEKERFEGKITVAEAAPATKITTNTHTGKTQLAQDPSLYDLNLTIQAAAVESSSSISASGTAIRVGTEAAIRGKGFAGYGFIIDLKTVE